MKSKPIKKLLLLEINEVPWRIIDRFKNDSEFPNIKIFFDLAKTYTTKAVDDGELSPWITWPTVHRGNSSDKHGIRFLGQDPKTFQGTAIWDDLLESGYDIGICGSLQSWPPRNPGKNGFYIPDTFARDDSCFPKFLGIFQKFNLRQTNANKRVINRGSLFSFETINVLMSLRKLGIRFKTVSSLLAQLALELMDRKRTARRPIYQAVLFWDIFRKLYIPKQAPHFSTFFTNHVASTMHRYWHETFPEDFSDEIRCTADRKNQTMRFAIKVLDDILKDALAIQKTNPEIILAFASSMGQGPITWERFEGFSTVIYDLKRLIEKCVGPEIHSLPLLAMVPQITVEIKDPAQRLRTMNVLESASTYSGEKLFFTQENLERLSISIRTPSTADIESGGFYFNNKDLKTWTTWADTGIRVENVGLGTGYHLPEGVLAIVSNETVPIDSRIEIQADQVKELLFRLMGFNRFSEKSLNSVLPQQLPGADQNI